MKLFFDTLRLTALGLGLVTATACASETNISPAAVDDATMQRIFDEVKTQFKYGVILRGDSTNQLVDCPSVFRSGKKWFMMYVAISDAVGYEGRVIGLATSRDLRGEKPKP